MTLDLRETPTAEAHDGLTATYGGTLADVAIPNPAGNTPGTWTWDAPSTPVGNAGEGTFPATFTPDDTTNYDTVSATLTVTVNKATPDYTAPTGLTAAVGHKLSTVALLAGWAWDDATQTVGSVGDGSFAATFTPSDMTNFDTVSAMLTVTGTDDPDAHSWGEGVVTTDPTCTLAGEKTYTCTLCSATKKEPVAALGHNLTTVTVDATCTATGSKTTTCSRCDYKVVEEIPALGHDFGEWTTITAATTEAEGLEKRFLLALRSL